MTVAVPDPRAPIVPQLERFGPRSEAAAPTREEAIAYTRTLATSHYENFSVLSSLVPADLRDDFGAVYAFCRWADDLGDETGHDEAARTRSLELLAWWREELRACFAGEPRHAVFVALAETVRKHALPIEPFDHLIQAFEQDQRVQAYDTWAQVLDYCTRSANPVGRLVLMLAGHPDVPENRELFVMSDATCTALQLTNFWQDVRRDLVERDRIYMPAADTNITPAMLRDWMGRPNDPEARVPFILGLRGLVEKTWPLFKVGQTLPDRVDPRIRPVIWLFGAGGQAVLNKVERCGCTTLWTRPRLGKASKLALVARAWIMAKTVGRSGK
ncbi:MAG: squalene synthase HpnC [Phycisphaerales bacterium]